MLRDTCEESTISGVASFFNNNQWHEGLDDDDACAAKFYASLVRSRILSSSKNMMRYFLRLHKNQVRAGDETFKIFLNGNSLIVNEVVDKKNNFHPTVMVF